MQWLPVAIVVILGVQPGSSDNSNNKYNFDFVRNFTNKYFSALVQPDGLITTNSSSKLIDLTSLGARFAEDGSRRGRHCLRNLTKCMEESPDYDTVLYQLSNYLFGASPPFDLSNVDGVSDKCRQSSQRYMEDLHNYKLWALKMYDASAKLPSGLLSGNVNQFGHFDQCLSASNEESQIGGQYCLASMQVEAPDNPYLSAVHNLVQAHSPFKSKLRDPGHRVPRFSSIIWGLCVPDSCSSADVALGLKSTLDRVLNNTRLEFELDVDPNMCQSIKTSRAPWSTYVVSLFFISVAIWAIIATVYDVNTANDRNDLILAFSLRKNMRALLSTRRSEDDIATVHGIRFTNAVLLLFAHKSIALFFVPFVNRTEMSELLGQPWTVLGRAASLYTDPFIMLSGTLSAYTLFGRLQKSNRIDITQEYTSRLFRIVPTFGALILFCTFVLPWLGSGPLWNLVVTHHSDICKQHWWRNMLFIHNYFGFKDMCLTHTHHVGIDMQLFFLSPFLILLLWKLPKSGFALLMSLAAYSTLMRYSVTMEKNLSNYVHYGTSIDQLFKTADYMYILPLHRLTVYIMGIFLGSLLRNVKDLKLSPTLITLGHSLSFFSVMLAFFGPAFMGNMDYVYNPVHAAWYAAFAPIFWCFGFAWIILASHYGLRGDPKSIAHLFDILPEFVSYWFSLQPFRIWTKISYAVYLTQFPIYFFNVGSARSSREYSFFADMMAWNEYFAVIGASILLTLLFESPFQNIRKALFVAKSENVKAIGKDKVS